MKSIVSELSSLDFNESNPSDSSQVVDADISKVSKISSQVYSNEYVKSLFP